MQKTETTKFRLSYNVKSAVISSEVEKSYEIRKFCCLMSFFNAASKVRFFG